MLNKKNFILMDKVFILFMLVDLVLIFIFGALILQGVKNCKPEIQKQTIQTERSTLSTAKNHFMV